ncbi:MAG: anti-sigma factor family protein [Candidatus Eiseniibacteriota bacterium]
MTGDAGLIREDDLHALVDGQLDEARRAGVERWLQAHPEDAARLAGWRRQNAAIEAAFGPVADEPVPERLRPRLPGRRFGTVAALAASIALFVAGAVAGWIGHGEMGGERAMELRLADRAIAAHRVYAVEVRHPVEVAASDEQHLVTWLSKRLDYKLRVPDLTRAGYHLIGGRLLANENGPAAQFMYEDSAGKRITVYCSRVMKGRETAFRFQHAGAIGAFYWLDGAVGYAIIGEMPRPALLTLAHSVYDQLEK